MAIITDFTFGHKIADAQSRGARPPAGITVQSLTPPAAPKNVLGDLAFFLPGAARSAVWEGSGFNLIWRPDHDKLEGHPNPNDFFLELDETTETISFQNISGNVPGRGIANRGAKQKNIEVGGIAYTQEIGDANHAEMVDKELVPVGLHFEPGVWINVEATTDPSEPASISRMGSIPHGTTVNLQGQSLGTVTNAAGFDMTKVIKPASITPSQINPKDARDESVLQPFPKQETIDPKAPDGPSRTAISSLKHVDQKHLTDPNQFLLDAVAGMKITTITTLVVASDRRDRPKSAPDVGGGTANIAFLQGNPDPNADAAPASAIFWLEEGTDKAGRPVKLIQYSQRVLLKFNGLNWPHVSVGTLRPKPPKAVG